MRRSLWVDQRALPLQEGKTAHVVQMPVREEQQLEIFGEHVQLGAMTQGTIA